MKAKIFEIKRFAVHDGDGIRTTVFFKGCPLKCVWCHNPEGISPNPQLAYYNNKCIKCGNCVAVCEAGAQKIDKNGHFLDRDLCKLCGKCAKVCMGNALRFYGQDFTVEELIPILLEDKEFYIESGGGVTLSGGECLLQADFCEEIMRQLKENGVHTAVDTCGFIPKESIDKVMPYTDIFLYDIKAYDESVHTGCTGRSNEIILDNIKYIDDSGKKTEIRIPYVPSYNSEQVEKIAEFLRGLKNLTKVRILPYHNYASSKYKSLDMENTLPERLPTQLEIQSVVEEFRKKGLNCV